MFEVSKVTVAGNATVQVSAGSNCSLLVRAGSGAVLSLGGSAAEANAQAFLIGTQSTFDIAGDFEIWLFNTTGSAIDVTVIKSGLSAPVAPQSYTVNY